MPDGGTDQLSALSPLLALLRCLECSAPVELVRIEDRPDYPELGPDGWLACTSCGERYPVTAGTARMVEDSARDGQRTIKEQTAQSFAYEWVHFGQPRTQWRKNFLDYMQPHAPRFFAGKLVLDVGAGSGRHTVEAAQLGADVVAVDIGASIDVARRNVSADVLTVQADAERLPFAPETFDFVMSIGVLHHLPDPDRALKSLTHYARPGGWVHVYLYWQPERAWHRALLKLVTAVRRVTVRMPHRLLHQLCYPLAAFLWISFVLPYRALRDRPIAAWLAAQLPLKTYADYPFGVLVNDQFDRFSAPLERRYTQPQVHAMLLDAGLVDVNVRPNHGWVAEGRVPATGIPPRAKSATSRPGIAVVAPIRDDPGGAAALLNALAAQTRAPDEVIIVNDGSTDGTRKLLEERQGSPLAYRIVDTQGIGIAAARNLGVEHAHHEWIACTDAGCVPVPGWLQAIEQASDNADFVAGVAIVDATSTVERALALSVFSRADELDEPPLWIRVSHRLFGRGPSDDRTGGGYMAFRRTVWEAVGGFPPGLRASDDRGFSTRVARARFRMVRAREAAVHWHPRSSLSANLAMFFNYARGDVRIHPRGRHVLRALTYVGAPLILRRGGPRARTALAGGIVGYLWLPFYRARTDDLALRQWWRIPLTVALKDVAQVLGAAMGILDAARNPRSGPPSRSASGTRAPRGT